MQKNKKETKIVRVLFIVVRFHPVPISTISDENYFKSFFKGSAPTGASRNATAGSRAISYFTAALGHVECDLFLLHVLSHWSCYVQSERVFGMVSSH